MKEPDTKREMTTIIDDHNLEILSISVFISFLVTVTMGSMISLFRRSELDTAAQLEVLEKNLKEERAKKEHFHQRKSTIARTFRFYGICIFLLLLVGLWLTWPNVELLVAIGMAVSVFVLYPVVFFLLRKLCKNLLERRFKKCEDSIKELEKEKREILETVMEKEPYNKAKEILKKYDPSILRSHDAEDAEKKNENVRKRIVSQSKATPDNRQLTRHQTPQNLNATLPVRPSARTPVSTPQFTSPQLNRKRPNTVRPLPGDTMHQSKMDKIVGWVTGSNPEQMFALICRNCCEHNGLAAREEFDFLEWRCAYCHYLNKARKERPVAPRLPEQRPMTRPSSASSSSPASERAGLREKRSNSLSSSGSSSLQIRQTVREDSGTESDQMENKELSATITEDNTEQKANSKESGDEFQTRPESDEELSDADDSKADNVSNVQAETEPTNPEQSEL